MKNVGFFVVKPFVFESRGTVKNKNILGVCDYLVLHSLCENRNQGRIYSPITGICSTRLSWILNTGAYWTGTCSDGASGRMMMMNAVSSLSLRGSRHDCFYYNVSRW